MAARDLGDVALRDEFCARGWLTALVNARTRCSSRAFASACDARSSRSDSSEDLASHILNV
jgi:ferritin-like protein